MGFFAHLLGKDHTVALDFTEVKAIAADVKAKADAFITALPQLEAKAEEKLAEAERELATLTADLTEVRDKLAAATPAPATPAPPASQAEPVV